MLSFFQLDVLDKIWDLIESISEGFLTYSFKTVHVFESISDRLPENGRKNRNDKKETISK